MSLNAGLENPMLHDWDNFPFSLQHIVALSTCTYTHTYTYIKMTICPQEIRVHLGKVSHFHWFWEEFPDFALFPRKRTFPKQRFLCPGNLSQEENFSHKSFLGIDFSSKKTFPKENFSHLKGINHSKVRVNAIITWILHKNMVRFTGRVSCFGNDHSGKVSIF